MSAAKPHSARPARCPCRDERLHRRGLPQGRSAGFGPAGLPPRASRETPSGSVSGRVPRPRRNWTERWPPSTASICECPTSPTRSPAPRSTLACWTTSTSTCPTSRRWCGRASSATSTSPSSRSAGIPEDGELIPSTSVGNNKTWIDQADRVILEVNSWQPAGLDGMHDIYYGTALPPHRKPIQILTARTGSACPTSSARPRRSSPSSDQRPDRDNTLQRARPRTRDDRRPRAGVPGPRGRQGRLPPEPAATAIRRRQHSERGAGRLEDGAVRTDDRLHRGHPGRHASLLRRPAAFGLGDRVFVEP